MNNIKHVTDCNQPTDSTEHSPSEKANSYSPSPLPSPPPKITARISRNPEVHYRFSKRTPLVPILSQINALQTHILCFLKFTVIFLPLQAQAQAQAQAFQAPLPFRISNHNSVGLLISLLHHTFHMPSPSLPPWREHSNYTWWAAQMMKLLTKHFSPVSCFFLCTLFKNSLSLRSCTDVTDQVPHSYKVTKKMTWIWSLL